MKKCPKCGNPSYDGAPVCGNCGYNFPKPKSIAAKREDIFQKEPKVDKKEKTKKTKEKSTQQDTLTILKENKLLIGAILLITIIVICGIVLINSNNGTNSPLTSTNDAKVYSAGEFTLKYSNEWSELNKSDAEHPGAQFFQNTKENVTIEFYNVTTQSNSVKEIAQDIITSAQGKGAYVELVETVTIDGRNTSNIVLEDADGDYTRYVSMFSDGKTYVLKVNGASMNSVTSESVESVIKSADIA